MPGKFKYTLLAFLAILAITSGIGCLRPGPKETVQVYLRMLSGERTVTESALRSIATENYLSSEHPHLISMAHENGDRVLDTAAEIRNDPAIRELFRLVSWETEYEVSQESDTKSVVLANVTMSERKPGDFVEARSIKDLPEPFLEVLENETVLRFRFTLLLEDDRWKIDDFEFPEVFIPLLDFPSVSAE